MNRLRWKNGWRVVAESLGLTALVGLSSCGVNALPGGGSDQAVGGGDFRSPVSFDMAAPDLAVVADLASPVATPDLAGFCGNPKSGRIELNGMLAASPSVGARQLVLNCCEAAAIEVISMQIATPITVVWRHQGGPLQNPITLDLANLPVNWSVLVFSGCSPANPPCQPTDQYDSDLRGTLSIVPLPGGYQMSACLTVAEPGGKPHPVIHSLRLWTPPVNTR